MKPHKAFDVYLDIEDERYIGLGISIDPTIMDYLNNGDGRYKYIEMKKNNGIWLKKDNMIGVSYTPHRIPSDADEINSMSTLLISDHVYNDCLGKAEFLRVRKKNGRVTLKKITII